MGLLLSLLATGVSGLLVSHSVRASDEARFANVTGVARERLLARMKNYGAILRGTERLVAVEQERINAETFHTFVEGLGLAENFGGIRGLGFGVRLDPSEPESLAARLYGDAVGALPETDNVTYPVLFFEPLDASTSAAIGFDMGSESVRFEAMEYAARTGEMTLSGPLPHHTEVRPGDRPGFNLYMPVYEGSEAPVTPEEREAQLLGFVFAPFRAGDLFIRGLTGDEVDYEVFDGETPGIENLLLTSRTQVGPPSAFTDTERIELFGRVWTLQFHSRPVFERSTLGRTVPWVVGAGLLLSFLIFLMLRWQVRAQRTAEDHLRTLKLVVDSGVAAIVVVDRRTQHMVEANEAFLRMVGCTRRDLERGRYVLTDFLEEEDGGAGATDRLSPTEQILRRADGSQVPILVGRAPLPGEPAHEVVVGSDLSERKAFEMALKESQTRYELAVRATRDVIWDMDLETKQLQWAGGGRAAFGLDRAQYWSLSDTMAKIHPGDRERILASLRGAIANPKTVRWEESYRFRRYEGSYAYVTDRAFLVREKSGRPVRMVGSISDESDRHRVEAERAELLSEAREGVRIRDEFLSVASHELKTPLTPLSLRLEKLGLIAQREAAENPELAREILTQVGEGRRQVFKMTELIANLLDVSRIDSGHMRTYASAVELASVVRVATERRRPEARRAGSTMVVDLESPIWGTWDPDRLEQIVDNLVANAIKYGERGKVEVTLATGEPGWVTLSVRDYGIGIDLENQSRIFDRFARAVSDRHYGGLGLGLYVTRSMVEALGGTISVESRPGEGSLFTVQLPHHHVDPATRGHTETASSAP